MWSGRLIKSIELFRFQGRVSYSSSNRQLHNYTSQRYTNRSKNTYMRSRSLMPSMQILYWLNIYLITTLSALKTTSQLYTPNLSLLLTYSIHLMLDRLLSCSSGIDRCLKTCMTADSASAIRRQIIHFTTPKQRNSYSQMSRVSESGTRAVARYTHTIYLACTGTILIYTTTCTS